MESFPSADLLDDRVHIADGKRSDHHGVNPWDIQCLVGQCGKQYAISIVRPSDDVISLFSRLFPCKGEEIFRWHAELRQFLTENGDMKELPRVQQNTAPLHVRAETSLCDEFVAILVPYQLLNQSC